jgi:hypothetical protein
MELINKYSNIKHKIHLILTKINYEYIDKLILDIHNRQINADIEIVNLHAYEFNKYTNESLMYTSKDSQIYNWLKKCQKIAQEYGLKLTIPDPTDKIDKCGSFWSRFQTWPVYGIDAKKYQENVIIGGCRAVVNGNLNTLGYIFDYNNIMDLWNNEHFALYRSNLIKGIYPDKECAKCQSFMGRHQ